MAVEVNLLWLLTTNHQSARKALRSQRWIASFGWLVADKCVRVVVGLLVGVMVARHLGVVRFGILSYALALVGLFLPLAELGMEAVVRRRLISSPEFAGRVLLTVLRLRLVAAVLAYAGVFAYALFWETDDARVVVLIVGLSLFQPAGFTVDLWLQSTSCVRLSVILSWGGLIVGSCLRLWLIGTKSDLAAFAWVAVVENGVACVLLWLGARKWGPPLTLGKVGLGRETRALVADAWPMLLSGMAVTLYMRIDMMMLRALVGDGEVGAYSAAVRLSEAGYFVPGALAVSVLPGLLRRRAEGARAYAESMQRYYDLSAGLAFGLAASTSVLAGPLVAFIYGPAFAGAADVLRWHTWAGVFVFLGVARTQFMVNERRLLLQLATTAAGTVVNIGLNACWIPTHGALGAAWATVVAYGVAAWGASWVFPSTRETAVMQTRALLLPVLGWRYLFRR